MIYYQESNRKGAMIAHIAESAIKLVLSLTMQALVLFYSEDPYYYASLGSIILGVSGLLVGFSVVDFYLRLRKLISKIKEKKNKPNQ